MVFVVIKFKFKMYTISSLLSSILLWSFVKLIFWFLFRARQFRAYLCGCFFYCIVSYLLFHPLIYSFSAFFLCLMKVSTLGCIHTSTVYISSIVCNNDENWSCVCRRRHSPEVHLISRNIQTFRTQITSILIFEMLFVGLLFRLVRTKFHHEMWFRGKGGDWSIFQNTKDKCTS